MRRTHSLSPSLSLPLSLSRSNIIPTVVPRNPTQFNLRYEWLRNVARIIRCQSAFYGRFAVAQCCLREAKELPEMDITRGFLEAKVLIAKTRREDIAAVSNFNGLNVSKCIKIYFTSALWLLCAGGQANKSRAS